MPNLRRICVFLPVMALAISSAIAQTGTGTVRGTMTDDSGGVIPAANVTLTGKGGTKTAQTQADGSYVFQGLAPGQYNVKVAFPGFAPIDKPVNVTAGGNVVLPIQLVLAAAKQEITVADQSTTAISVEPDNNATALVLRGEDLAALPDDPDDLSDALQALAGPGAGPNGGSIYIDGFSGGQLPPKESIREIRINQNPFSAEYDKLGFGRIEILTKPGTRQGSRQRRVQRQRWHFQFAQPHLHQQAGFLQPDDHRQHRRPARQARQLLPGFQSPPDHRQRAG